MYFLVCMISLFAEVKTTEQHLLDQTICTVLSAFSAKSNYITQHLYYTCQDCSNWFTCINSFQLCNDHMSEILLKYYFLLLLHTSLLCYKSNFSKNSSSMTLFFHIKCRNCNSQEVEFSDRLSVSVILFLFLSFVTELMHLGRRKFQNTLNYWPIHCNEASKDRYWDSS